MMDTAVHMEHLARALQQHAPGRLFWSGAGFLEDVPTPLREALGEEWSLSSVEGYLSLRELDKSGATELLTVVLAAPCLPEQLAAVRMLETSGHLGCLVVLERRRPASWGGWTLPAPLSPLAKRHSATGSYLEELGFKDGGWIEWESGERCVAKLREAVDHARVARPGFFVVTLPEEDVEEESKPEFAPAELPSGLERARPGSPDTVYGRFSREIPKLVHARKLLWLDESQVEATGKTTELHLRTFRTLESDHPGRPVVVIPSSLLPSLYGELRFWCQDGGPQAPVLVVHSSGIPIAGEPGAGGLTDGHLLMSIPGLTLARPSDEPDARVLFAEAMNLDGPAALVFSQAPAVGLTNSVISQTGKGRRLREGKDIAILAIGSTVFPSLLAAESLQTVGLTVAVHDLRYRRPVDRELLEEVAHCRLLVTAEEGPESSSFASHLLSSERSSARLLRLTVEVEDLWTRLGQGEDPSLFSLETFGMHAEGIAKAIKSALGMGPSGEY